MEYNYSVFIGRFQPFHNSHLEVALQALEEAKELIIVVGSAKSARTTKNPWSYEERVEMIKSCFNVDQLKRIHFIPARDYYYNDSYWVTEIQQRVNAITRGDSNICLVGTYKDSSSYYIKLFPQWDFVPSNSTKSLNATDIRNLLFSAVISPPETFEQVPRGIREWIVGEFIATTDHKNLCEEFKYLNEYKQKFAALPYPITFNTYDAVVIQSGHVLVVKRKFNPGKGLYALPGGFLKQTETLEAGAIRELKEETGIKVHAPVLKSHIVDSKTFDFPGRSLRGRTITTAFCIKLPDGELPEVKGSDDAEYAVWLPLMDVLGMEEKFFEDHAHIIRYFMNRF